MDVPDFLTSIGFGNLIEKFSAEDIDMAALLEMDQQDWKEMGVEKKGQRLRILAEITKLKTSGETSPSRKNQANTTKSETSEHEKWIPPMRTSDCTDSDELKDDDVPPEIGQNTFSTDKATTKDEITVSSEVVELLEKITELKRKSKGLISNTYDQILHLFQSDVIFPALKSEMVEEFGEIKYLIKEAKEDMDDDSCPIVITGETSAGKSTFVNLLIGVDLMPQSSLSCTSTICRIFNNPNKAVFLTDSNDHRVKVEEFETTDMNTLALKKMLKEYVCVKKSNDEKRDEYKYVDIHWPIPYLQKNVVIVDTPGIGPDNPELTTRLFEYLKNALAFIYILNTPNAGGVQSDRILKIQEELTRHDQKNKEKKFDPQRAIFICNKWDQIHEEPDDVFQSVKSQLEDKWVGFQKDKLYKLSARQDIIDSRMGKPISSDLKAVIKGLERMVPATAEEKIRKHLKWQENYLDRLMLKLTARIRNTLKTKEEKLETLQRYEQQITKVKENAYSMEQNLRKKAEDKCLEIVTRLHEHLNLPETKQAICSWSQDILPDFTTMKFIEEAVDELINDSITHEIRKVLKTEVHSLSEYITKLFNSETLRIGKKLFEVDKIILGHHTLPPGIPEVELETEDMILLAVLSRIINPLGKVFDVPAVRALAVGIVTVKQAIVDRDNVKKYRKDKVHYASERAEKYISTITLGLLKEHISSFLLKNIEDRIEEYFKEVIPKRIAAGETLVQNMTNDLREPRLIREQCHQVEDAVIPIYGDILGAYMEIFEERVLTRDDVKIQSMGYAKNNISCQVRGGGMQWVQAVMSQKKFKGDRRYRNTVLAEISILRKCQHTNIIQLYGISTFNYDPKEGCCLYSEPYDKSFDKEIIEGELEWSVGRRYLKDSLDGLFHMHRLGLVHKNLRLENILIKEGDAKLWIGGIPELVKPEGEIDGVPIIRAPEVLKGSCCGYEADMFQFGIILWECWYRKRAFFDEGKAIKATYEELYEFIIKGHMLDLTDPKPKEEMLKAIKRCWDENPDHRPSAREVQDSV